MGGRGVKITIVVLVVLAGLFVAADRIALAYAQSEAADHIRSDRGLSHDPKVSIKGFPFLTQLAGRKLDEVVVTATDVETDPGMTDTGDGRLHIARLTSDLHGVRISGNFSRAVADSATGTALISYADLSAGAPSGVTVSYGGRNASGKGQVKVTGGITLPGLGAVRRSVLSDVTVTSGDSVRLHAGTIPGANTIPGLDHLIRSRIDFDRRLTGLPSGITLKSVDATAGGVKVALTGRNVNLSE